MSQELKIENGVYVGPEVWEGDLDLRNNTEIKSLGKLKVVAGGLNAKGVSALCDLGCLEEVGGYIGVVSADLDIRGTSVQSLGSLKKVRGYLDAEGVSTLRDLGCLGEVGGYTDIRGTNVRSLGSLKNVGVSLDAERVSTLCDLGCLGEVGRWLDIRGTSVRSLGSLEKVGTFFKLDGSSSRVPYEDFLKDLEALRNTPAEELSTYLYDPKYSHPLYQEALGRS